MQDAQRALSKQLTGGRGAKVAEAEVMAALAELVTEAKRGLTHTVRTGGLTVLCAHWRHAVVALAEGHVLAPRAEGRRTTQT